MGMHALMDVRCKNLVNPLCDWLGETYDPASREFVIPGRGRLPLDKESVFYTLGVPRGELNVPYEVDNDIEKSLFARLFPGMESMPNTTALATALEGMRTHGEIFKMKLLICKAKIGEVKNMNWCKFIANFLHDAFSNKMYQKGCRLHLMLMYVDRLDLSTVDFTGVGGPPPPHKFAVSAWTYDAVKAVLAADRISETKYGKLQLMAKHAIDYSVFGGPQNFGKWMDVHSAPSCTPEARAPVEALVGQFASGMTGLLGKLVGGLTALKYTDTDGVARQFSSYIGERTNRPTGCRGRYDYNSSQEVLDTQDELVGDEQDDDVELENVHHEAAEDEHADVRADAKKGKAGLKVTSSEKGNIQTVARDTAVSPSKRGRAAKDAGQGSAAKRSRTDPVAARRSEPTAGGRASTKKHVATPTRASARLNRGAANPGDTTSNRLPPRALTSNTGDPVVLPNMRKQIKKCVTP
ncbi:uncharacterized protein LOC119293023 [Triticum dicoccoides]|uniref:uncharacterized protein LOC119293023 n=1 Tax=Triticum dicoccoides TaxID=85692 RepID=UPI0018907D9D|nr:uncharacterized protein LOC119293023 [Triticum dicoccoides]